MPSSVPPPIPTFPYFLESSYFFLLFRQNPYFIYFFFWNLHTFPAFCPTFWCYQSLLFHYILLESWWRPCIIALFGTFFGDKQTLKSLEDEEPYSTNSSHECILSSHCVFVCFIMSNVIQWNSSQCKNACCPFISIFDIDIASFSVQCSFFMHKIFCYIKIGIPVTVMIK